MLDLQSFIRSDPLDLFSSHNTPEMGILGLMVVRFFGPHGFLEIGGSLGAAIGRVLQIGAPPSAQMAPTLRPALYLEHHCCWSAGARKSGATSTRCRCCSNYDAAAATAVLLQLVQDR